jgi:Flp pilus assembly protein CpaB
VSVRFINVFPDGGCPLGCHRVFLIQEEGNMKPRTLILLTVAVGCGLVAAFLVSQGKSQPMQPDLPIAKAEIRPGTFIDDPEKFFVRGEKPIAQIGPKTIKSVEQLRGKMVQKVIPKDDLVNADQIVDSGGLTDKLKEGYRAQTIRVTIESAVAGFIIPTSHVDLMTLVPDPKDPKKQMARIFMENVEVLAVNTEDVKPEGVKAMAQPGMVTLAVTPKQAEIIARATRDGIPTLVLRKPGDNSKAGTHGASTPFGQGDTPEEAALDSKKVLVAKAEIPAGTMLTANLFDVKTTTEPYPDAVIEGKMSGRKADKVIKAGTVLTEGYLANDSVTRVSDDPPVRSATPRVHQMHIYDGPTRRTETFGGDARETLAPPPGKEGGSEGK